MRTLIVPCAGNHSIDNVPLVICHDINHVLVAHKAINGLYYSNFDKIIFAVTAESESEFHIKESIKANLPFDLPIEISIIDSQTIGPAETVYKVIKQQNITGEIAIKDLPNQVITSYDFRGNFIAGLDLLNFTKEINNLKSKSFIIENEQHRVLDIIEKRFRSDVISVGYYGFKSADEYSKAFERLIDICYPIEKIYVSQVISYLIGYYGKQFQCYEVDDFDDWSTNYKQQFYSPDYSAQKELKLAIFDLDGTLFDTVEVNYLAYKEALFKYNYNIDRDYFRQYCNGRHYTDFLPQITTSDESILTDIHNIKKACYSKYLSEARPNYSLFSLIDKMRPSTKIALVTTASRKNTIEILQYFCFLDKFDLILTKEDVVHTKPHPEGFLKAIEYFKVTPSETMIFEDSETGLIAAKETNSTILATLGYN